MYNSKEFCGKSLQWHKNYAIKIKNYVIQFQGTKCTFDSVKKIIAISLSLVLLLSNVGFSLTTHFCGGHAVKSALSLGGTTLDCGMGEQSTASPECDRPGHNLKAGRCCDNQQRVLQTDDNHPTEATSLVQGSHGGLTPPLYIFLSEKLLIGGKFQKTSFYPPPPLPARDVQVLFQTFLI